MYEQFNTLVYYAFVYKSKCAYFSLYFQFTVTINYEWRGYICYGIFFSVWYPWYSKTSLNRTLLFQKVIRFSKISVYTKCRIAPANRTKFGLGGGFSDVSDRSSKPSKVQITARAVECGDALKWTCKLNMKARKLQANPNIVRIAPCLTEICSVYVKARK